MKSTTILSSLALLASAANAQPHRPHAVRHQHGVHKRDLVWVTEIDYEIATVDVTTTVWVTDGQPEPTVVDASTTPAVSSTSSSKVVPTTSTSSTPVVVPTTSTSSTPIVAPTTSTSSTPIVEPSTVPTVADVPTTSSTPPVVYVPTTSSSTTPVVVPTTLATSTSSAAAVVASTGASIASTVNIDVSAIVTTALTSGSDCVGASCSGDLTYYTAGLGACGYDTDGSTVYGIALPHDFMGTASNSNPYCNMTLDITYGSTTVAATVIDKCMGCTGKSIDLTDALFSALGIEVALGRVQGDWQFTGPQTTKVFSASYQG